MVWFGTVWHGMAWHGMAWYGIVRQTASGRRVSSTIATIATAAQPLCRGNHVILLLYYYNNAIILVYY